MFFALPLYAQPLFDSHLHYSKDDAQHFAPQEIIQRLDKNTIPYAAVTGTPAKHVTALYKVAPKQVVPLLSVYRRHEDKSIWTQDESVIPYLKQELAHAHWRGIGELHVFADDRHSKVFKQVITLASAKQLPLLIHADPAVIDTVYEIAPKHRVIWAHAGTFPYPDLVANYLQRYPNLSVDVSMRDRRIAPNGEIDDDWYELFVSYPDRFMVGVDTFSTSRWNNYDSAVGVIRHWLAQLPDDVAQQLAFVNATNFYNKPLNVGD